MATIALYRGPTRGYSLSDTDVLWLARAFVGEFEGHLTRKNAQWHFWSWMDRFLLVNGFWLRNKRPFHELLTAHSQAINPIWMEAGRQKCANSSTGACAPDRIARRHRMCSLSINQLESYGAYAWALEAQNGTLERPIGEPIYDFAACSAIIKNQSDRPCYGKDIDGQCFLIYDCLYTNEKKAVKKNADGSLAEVEGGITTKRLGITALGILFGVVVTWAVWTLYSKRKR